MICDALGVTASDAELKGKQRTSDEAFSDAIKRSKSTPDEFSDPTYAQADTTG